MMAMVVWSDWMLITPWVMPVSLIFSRILSVTSIKSKVVAVVSAVPPESQYHKRHPAQNAPVL